MKTLQNAHGSGNLRKGYTLDKNIPYFPQHNHFLKVYSTSYWRCKIQSPTEGMVSGARNFFSQTGLHMGVKSCFLIGSEVYASWIVMSWSSEQYACRRAREARWLCAVWLVHKLNIVLCMAMAATRSCKFDRSMTKEENTDFFFKNHQNLYVSTFYC